jgi:type IV secretory pathway VirB3-like protein
VSSPVCRSFTRPKLIHGIEWKMFYLILLGCMLVGFTALWNPRRLLLMPIIYFGLYVTFRWAGKHDSQWAAVYPVALSNRTIFLAGADASKPGPKPPRRVIFKFPKFNA